MSAPSAVRAEPQRHDQPAGTEEAVAERQSPFVEMSYEVDEAYPPRRVAPMAVLGVTTLVSVGALLGARFVGRRRVTHGRRSIRVKGGSPRILIMLPFTAVNLYGRRSRRFGRFGRFGLQRLNVRHLHHARATRLQMISQLRDRLRQRMAAGR
jgi:hypothetical protein